MYFKVYKLDCLLLKIFFIVRLRKFNYFLQKTKYNLSDDHHVFFLAPGNTQQEVNYILY